LIFIESAFGIEFPAAFVATTEKLYMPGEATGVPEITPVVGLRDKPAGKLPLDIDHVIGIEPVADKP